MKILTVCAKGDTPAVGPQVHNPIDLPPRPTMNCHIKFLYGSPERLVVAVIFLV
jgi:hypothetical protein